MQGYMPNVFERLPNGVERAYDLPSRLLKDRIVMLNGEVNGHMSRAIVAQLLFLDSQDNKKPIQLYINSPGGSITEGMAILDTMKMIKSPVHTIVNGLAASMGAFLLSCGDKRYALPNAEVMIHQPLGGTQGQATDIEIGYKRIQRMKLRLAEIMAHQCGKKKEELLDDMERDLWLLPKEALEYGLIDEILKYPKDFIVVD